jgi:hypothetical protein
LVCAHYRKRASFNLNRVCETLRGPCDSIPQVPRSISYYFLLSALRDADAAKRLFRNALSDLSHPQPRVINTDIAPIYGSAIADLKKEGTVHTENSVG